MLLRTFRIFDQATALRICAHSGPVSVFVGFFKGETKEAASSSIPHYNAFRVYLDPRRYGIAGNYKRDRDRGVFC